eukprot:scaffold595_cov182-Prasinococcus_capsulatus_cf.AAC.2
MATKGRLPERFGLGRGPSHPNEGAMPGISYVVRTCYMDLSATRPPRGKPLESVPLFVISLPMAVRPEGRGLAGRDERECARAAPPQAGE